MGKGEIFLAVILYKMSRSGVDTKKRKYSEIN